MPRDATRLFAKQQEGNQSPSNHSSSNARAFIIILTTQSQFRPIDPVLHFPRTGRLSSHPLSPAHELNLDRSQQHLGGVCHQGRTTGRAKSASTTTSTPQQAAMASSSTPTKRKTPGAAACTPSPLREGTELWTLTKRLESRGSEGKEALDSMHQHTLTYMRACFSHAKRRCVLASWI
jgi:hypothetical protein